MLPNPILLRDYAGQMNWRVAVLPSAPVRPQWCGMLVVGEAKSPKQNDIDRWLKLLVRIAERCSREEE